MLQDIDLRELAELRGNGRDVVSAYFAGAEGLSQLSKRQTVIADLLEEDPLEADNFAASMQNIRELLEDHDLSGATGVCAFSSEILDFTKIFPISMGVPNRLRVGPAPFIRPLAELQDEYETFAVVACDNERTRIFTVTNESAEVEAAVRGGIKNHVRKGGWSQQRYERRRDEQLNRYGDDVVEQLQTIVSAHDIHRIVLIGSDETMQCISDALSDTLASRVVGCEAFDLDRPVDDLIRQAYESYFVDERDDEQDLWNRIKSETLAEGRGCTGPADTIAAAQIGRVEQAIVTRDVKLPAAKCRDCEHVDAGDSSTCSACHSHNVFPVDLVDALARHLELTSATLNFVDEIKGLVRVGHVGALLRY